MQLTAMAAAAGRYRRCSGDTRRGRQQTESPTSESEELRLTSSSWLSQP